LNYSPQVRDEVVSGLSSISSQGKYLLDLLSFWFMELLASFKIMLYEADIIPIILSVPKTETIIHNISEHKFANGNSEFQLII
jgi:hypothetical protein